MNDRVTGLAIILAVGLPIVVMTTEFLTVASRYDRNAAIVLGGQPELEFWLLQGIRLLGLYLIVSGLVLVVSPDSVD